MVPTALPQRARFGEFELDFSTQELCNKGRKLDLNGHPFQILLALLERPNELVTREELKKRLWAGDTYVDFDHSLNRAINRLRDTLKDSADHPRFIETLPRRGYRFIAPVRDGSTPSIQPSPISIPERQSSSPVSGPLLGVKRSAVLIAALCLGIAGVVLLASGVFLGPRHAQQLMEKDTIVLGDFANGTDDPIFDDTLKQALFVDLEQSPFLHVLSDRKMAQTMQMMGRSSDDRLTATAAQELCQRAGGKALLSGSITNLGAEYLLILSATDCATGDSIATTRARASSKVEVLRKLDQASAYLRGRSGESLALVDKFSIPVEQATTFSLQALQAYSMGLKTFNTKGPIASLPFFERAADLDPKFAMAYAHMGTVYSDLGDFALAELNGQKAYELREKVSDREKLYIDSHYYTFLGEMEKAARVYEVWQRTYPKDADPYTDLGTVYSILGWYEAAREQYRVALRLEPSASYTYLNLGENYAHLNRLDEAEATYRQAEDQRIGEDWLPQKRYELAFLTGDTGEMARAAAIAAGSPSAASVSLSMQADTEAWYGRLRSARKLTRRAVESAEQQHDREVAAAYRAYSGLREAEFGYPQQARADAVAALKLTPNRTVEVMAALALARAGDAAEGLRVVDKLKADARTETMMQRYWIPTVQAAFELSRGASGNAIELLQVTRPYELGADAKLYPIYVRGQGYLRAQNGTAAAEEFQKILSHPGLVLNFHLGVLAYLQLGRAYALQGNTGKSRAAFQDFLTLWKDADPDIPILKEAKAEYAKLQ